MEDKFFIDDAAEFSSDARKKKNRWPLFIFIVGAIFLLVGWLIVNFLLLPPNSFPVDEKVVVPVGATANEVSELMKENDFVRSKLVFYLYLAIFSEPSSIKAGTYSFGQPLAVSGLTEELTKGSYAHDLIKFTHIEGERVEVLAKRAAGILVDFDELKFIKLAESLEGRLFPDTYMIPATYSEDELFTLLTKTFEEKIAPLQEKIDNHSLTLDEIIVLASILEREANSPESMRMVSGILQNRLAIEMPLQADASIEYVLDKPLAELTPEDLKIESPYNTYLNTGLPPTPIGNPGLEAIKAVLEPEQTEYLFYITDENGVFYYAKNFDEHKLNVARYLR